MAPKDPLADFIMFASQPRERFYIPFSLPSLNRLIGNKDGLMSGRILELVGSESTGKSTLALDLIKNAQRLEKRCLYVDIERTFHAPYAQACGVNIDTLQVAYPDTAENTLTLVERCAAAYDLIILDSIPTLLPKDELEKDYNDSAKMAAAAGLLTRFFKRVIPLFDTHNVLFVSVNQYRANISTMARVDKKPYGPHQLRHALTWRIELARGVREENRVPIIAKCTKNKLGPEQQVCEYSLVYGEGLDVARDILNLAIEYELIKKAGAWYTYGELRAQGLDKASTVFPLEELWKKLYEVM